MGVPTLASSITAGGIFIWLIWALVNGTNFEVLSVTSDEVAIGLDVLWKALIIAGPATSVVYGAMTARGR